jgi:hypothetical protein
MLNLKSKKYKVEKVTENGIFFDGQAGRSFKRLQKGKIEVRLLDGNSIIELKYYVNLLPPLVFFVFPLTFGIITKIYACPIVSAIALSIQELIRIGVWKDVAKSLLDGL